MVKSVFLLILFLFNLFSEGNYVSFCKICIFRANKSENVITNYGTPSQDSSENRHVITTINMKYMFYMLNKL